MDDFEKVGGGILRTGLSVVVGLAFTVAMSGLLAMAIYVTARRRREIGIRKTLGSSVFAITRLLLLNFSKPIIIGTVLAWPVAFLIARRVLAFLTAPAPLTVWPFILALVIAVLIGWLAVVIPAWRAARVNPADVLHYE
jgi:putative ABC transport system permease protein